MVINYTTGCIIGIIIILGVFAFFAWLITKKIPKIPPKFGALVAAIPTFVVCIPFFMMYRNPIYVVDKVLHGEQIFLIGSTEMDLGGGVTKKVSFDWSSGQVVNRSDKTLLLEVIWYGHAEEDRPSVLVPPHEAVSATKVDYFPQETPPDQVESKAGSSCRYWLREIDGTEYDE